MIIINYIYNYNYKSTQFLMFSLHIFSVTICCSQLNIQLVIDDKQKKN